MISAKRRITNVNLASWCPITVDESKVDESKVVESKVDESMVDESKVVESKVVESADPSPPKKSFCRSMYELHFHTDLRDFWRGVSFFLC